MCKNMQSVQCFSYGTGLPQAPKGPLMLDLSSVLEHIALEDIDLPIDQDFISKFLEPYFPDISQAELADKVAEVIAAELARRARR